MGLVPRAVSFGPLDLGTWMHDALAAWYGVGTERIGDLAEHFRASADDAYAIASRAGAPEHVLTKAEELAVLGELVARAYVANYRNDPTVHVLGAEVPLEFSIPNYRGNEVAALHRLKPDLIYRENRSWNVWLMEHKTAASISTEHLVIDDQARPYGAMAERALRRAGVLSKKHVFKGVMYNFLRKSLPDDRPRNKEGKYLNKNGSVSKRQPPAQFVRKPVTLTRAARLLTLRRVQQETIMVTAVTMDLRTRRTIPEDLPKTPHKSCPKFCQYFAMCAAEEDGADIREMQRTMYTRQDPYTYGETTEDPASFEMG